MSFKNLLIFANTTNICLELSGACVVRADFKSGSSLNFFFSLYTVGPETDFETDFQFTGTSFCNVYRIRIVMVIIKET